MLSVGRSSTNAIRTQFTLNPGLCAASAVPSPETTMLIRCMIGMLHQRVSLPMVCALLQVDEEVVHLVAIQHRLAAPRVFAGRGFTAHSWSLAECQRLIALWTDNFRPGAIALSIGRSASAVSNKARRLGLPPRERAKLVQGSCPLVAAIPVIETSCRSPVALAREQARSLVQSRDNGRTIWTDPLIRQVAELWKCNMSWQGIGAFLGVSGISIQSLAGATGMPSRAGSIKPVLAYHHDMRADPLLSEKMIERRCAFGNRRRIFFTRKGSGEIYAPATRRTRAFKDAMSAGLS